VRILRRVNPFSPELITFCGLLTAATLLFFTRPHRDGRQRLMNLLPLTAAVIIAVSMCNGCAVTGTNASPPPVVGTSSGMYSLVVTATAGGNVTATTTVNLTVN
jgi:hypothetical protein